MFLNQEELIQLRDEVSQAAGIGIPEPILDVLYRLAGCNKQILIDGVFVMREYAGDIPSDDIFTLLPGAILSERIKSLDDDFEAKVREMVFPTEEFSESEELVLPVEVMEEETIVEEVGEALAESTDKELEEESF